MSPFSLHNAPAWSIFPQLAIQMASEGFQGCRRQLHGATAAFGPGGGEYRAALRCRQRAPHLQHSGLKVDVASLEAEQLALPHAGVDGEDVERLQAIVTGGIEQPACLAGRERPHLLWGGPGSLDGLGRVAGHE